MEKLEKKVREKVLNSKSYHKRYEKGHGAFVGVTYHEFDEVTLRVPCNNAEPKVIVRCEVIGSISKDAYYDMMEERKNSTLNNFLGE